MKKTPPHWPQSEWPRPKCPHNLLHRQEVDLCDQGLLPERYSRNGSLTSPAKQAMLLRGRVLLVGLGGLGGHVLDSLVRMGVGHITGVDGDIFEASNLNRQLLCTQETLGMPKAQAAAAHVTRVNPAICFVPVARFVRGTGGPSCSIGVKDSGYSDMHALMQDGYDLVVDALGGLDDRDALHTAAQAAGIPVVTAGIAGLTGWVQVLSPTDPSPMRYFSQQKESISSPSTPAAPSAEQVLGNLAPVVCVAAGLQCAQVFTLLTGGKTPQEMLTFDLQDLFFIKLLQK